MPWDRCPVATPVEETVSSVDCGNRLTAATKGIVPKTAVARISIAKAFLVESSSLPPPITCMRGSNLAFRLMLASSYPGQNNPRFASKNAKPRKTRLPLRKLLGDYRVYSSQNLIFQALPVKHLTVRFDSEPKRRESSFSGGLLRFLDLWEPSSFKPVEGKNLFLLGGDIGLGI